MLLKEVPEGISVRDSGENLEADPGGISEGVSERFPEGVLGRVPEEVGG